MCTLRYNIKTMHANLVFAKPDSERDRRVVSSVPANYA